MDRIDIEIDANRKEFLDQNIASAAINFVGIQGGETKLIRSVILRADDKSSTNKIALYVDSGTKIGFQPTWYSNKGEAKLDVGYLTSRLLFLIPPPPEKFILR